jgi:hypothetical protein
VVAGAAGLLLVGAGGAVLGYRLAPVPGEVVGGGVNVRSGPGVEFPLRSEPLSAGTRVTISCAVDGYGRLSSPVEDGFVFLEAVDTTWTPRPCP